MFMRKKMREWMAAEYPKRCRTFIEAKITALVSAGLVTEKDADAIRVGPKDPAKPTIGPSKWMYWNVHLDGLERTHDLIVEREGVFKECILAIKMAKALGYQVATNTTIYKETDMREVEQMFDFLSDLGVDGHTISPGYEYDAAKKDMIKRLNLQPENFFLTRQMTIEKFKKIEQWMKRVHAFGNTDLFRISRRQARFELLGLGDPDPQHSRLERPVLSDDGRALLELSGVAGEGGVGQIRGRKRGGEGQPLRELHGPLRLRADCEPRPQRPAGRHLEDGALQLRPANPSRRAKGNELAAYNGVTSGNGHLTGKKRRSLPRGRLDCQKWR